VVGADGRLPLPWLAEPLAEALARQRGHALLVQGAAGIGALEFVLTLAQAWLCEAAAGTVRPCGRCASCHLVLARSHPDLLVLLPEVLAVALGWQAGDDEAADGEGARSKKKPSKQIRIDEVRRAIDWIAKTSSRARAKVLVIHPAESMNEQAASALLKTLEEPPAGARLLLSGADPALLLPTVRSRCQRLLLPPPGTELALQWLAGQGVQDAAVLLAAAGGRPLEAKALAEAGIAGAHWRALPQAVAQGRAQALAGWPVPRVVDALNKLCHDAMALAAGGAPRYFPAGSVPPGATLPALNAWASELARVARHDEHAWNEGLLVESLVSQGRAALAAAAPHAARALGTLKA